MILRDHDADDIDDHEWDDDETTDECPHCGASIYDDAERCPHCGPYLSSEDHPSRKPWWVVVGVIVCLAMTTWWIFVI